jgi:hypothetical protein
MLSKFAIFAVAVILAAPIYAGTGGGSSGGGSSAGAGGGGGGGHGGGGGGGGAGHSGGATGGGGHSGGLSGSAAAATAHSAVGGHELSSRVGMSHTDAMHATHLADTKHSEGEHTPSKSPDHRYHPSRREPFYGGASDQLNLPMCLPAAEMDHRSWFDCNGPTKSLPGHKS